MYNNLINGALDIYLSYVANVLKKGRFFDQMTFRKEFNDFTLIISSTKTVKFSVSVFKINSCNTNEELENYITNLWNKKFQVRLNKPNETEV